MIVRAFKQAEKAKIGDVVVACCGSEIADVVTNYGGNAVLTNPNLPSGTDRVLAALKTIDPGGTKYDHIINLQGDLPLIDPAHLALMHEHMTRTPYSMITLASPITEAADLHNPNIVKIAMKNIHAGQKTVGHYFSRSCIPSEGTAHFHHIGIYGFTKDTLARFVSIPPSYLEVSERLEQLRALEDGIKIDVVVVGATPQSVDTMEDLEKVRKMVRGS
jgi:3-deoxy-manno-octulosonate cytidylyltransferase (CMP-KDO synthetase)